MQRAVDLALRALAPVMPEQDHRRQLGAPRTSSSYSGFNEEQGEYWVYLEVDEGSYGGRPARDGLDSVDCLIANTRNNPIEELEWRFPMRTERYELRDEPCAAGECRGGIGMVRVNRFLVDTIVTCEGERHESDAPWGIFGGHDGLERVAGQATPDRPDEESWPSKVTGGTLPAGDTLQITVPNSGGYGDPLERDPRAVLSDVLDGFTTVELAERDYGVVIDRETLSRRSGGDDATAQRADGGAAGLDVQTAGRRVRWSRQAMTDLQRYLVEEIAVDHADGLITRREALRRLALVGLSVSAASSLLGAFATAGASGPRAGRTAEFCDSGDLRRDDADHVPRARRAQADGRLGEGGESPRRSAGRPREPRAHRPHPLGRLPPGCERILGARDRPALRGGWDGLLPRRGCRDGGALLRARRRGSSPT